MSQPQGTAGHYALRSAVAARTIQLTIRARLLRDVARLWPLLDGKRLEQSFPGWLAAMTQLLRGYYAQSATAGASFYRGARTAAVGSAGRVELAAAPSLDWMTRALAFAGPGLLSRDTARPGTALSTTLGTAARIALDGGRSTIEQAVKADPAAVGWYRVTDGHPCAFCALLASRGVVYKSDTAGFKSHNDCGCIGAPAFSRTQPLPALNDTAARIYTERGSGDALKAFRAAWAAHQAA